CKLSLAAAKASPMNRQSIGCVEHRRMSALSRRSVLQVGALGGLGVGLSHALRSEAQAAAGPAAKAKSVILLWLQGGVSHHETFDPKPDAPDDVRGEFVPIRTNLPGVAVGEWMPRLAGMMDKLAVVRSATHRDSGHQRASMWMVAGRQPGRQVSNEDINDNPDLGSIVAHQLGMRNGLPPYVSIPGNDFTSKFTGSGWLPAGTAPFKGVNAASLNVPVGFSNDLFDQRLSLRQSIDSLSARHAGAHPGGVAWDQFTEQAVDIIGSNTAGTAFRWEDEKDETLTLYGIDKSAKRRGQLPELCVTARRLVEAGVRYVTIGRNSWDHHSSIFPQIKERVPRFDAAFAGLITDLQQRGMLDETLVVYMTEFGRTPKVNSQAGRDHWPGVFSVAFAGAGIKTGQVLGASDKIGGAPAERPVSPEEIAATILSLAGVHPRTVVPKMDGRPGMFVDKANPIAELLA
ncbi:MAG: DUF1501 domain-containing protein, partial [Planctomycetales bacterium]|nr:DUF1501 domain-containing protein [Planctomycetales bacterium]